MDINPEAGVVSSRDIERAVWLYNAGASVDDFRASFAPEAVFTLWCAAVASFNVNQRMFEADDLSA